MSLTSPVLVAVLAVLAVGVVVAIVVVWPRLSATRPLIVSGRVGAIAVLNVTVLLLAFALLNDQFLFFTDWSDLVGAASRQGAPASTWMTAGAGASVAVAHTVDPVSRTPAPPSSSWVRSASRGSTTYLVTGGASHVTSEVLVTLPPGYNNPANASRRYPVLVGFGGYPSSVRSLQKGFAVPSALAGVYGRHELAPTVTVYVQPSTPRGRDTECVDGPGDLVETWAAVDVPAWVRSHFRARADRAAWATWGSSAGAWCAVMSTMLHPDTFGAALVFSGYFAPDWGNWTPFAPGDPRLRRYDLGILERTAPPPVALWLFASRKDRQSYPMTMAFLRTVHAPTAVTAQIIPTGGHRVTLWTPWLPVALAWLGHNVSGFAPAP